VTKALHFQHHYRIRRAAGPRQPNPEFREAVLPRVLTGIPGQRVALIGFDDGKISLLNVDDGKLSEVRPARDVPVTALDVSADGTRYAAAYLDGTLETGAWNEKPLAERFHLGNDAKGRQQSIITDLSVLSEVSGVVVANIGQTDFFNAYSSSGKTSHRIVSMGLPDLEKAPPLAASCSEALGQGVIALGMGDGRGVLLVDSQQGDVIGGLGILLAIPCKGQPSQVSG
jgi:hypothetical protein